MDDPVDWNHIKALRAVLDAGSLSAAARELGLAQPTLGRQIAALEASLGVTLFERTGRFLLPTEAARQLGAHAREMGAAAGRLQLAASAQSQAVEGLVRVTASDAVAAFVLPPILVDLRRLAPGITIEVVASNSISDLTRREADIAIRHVRPTEPDLIGRRLADDHAGLFATPAYLDSIGRPSDGATLAAVAEFIGFLDPGGEASRIIAAELTTRGVPITPVQFTRSTDGGAVAWEWVRRGLGVGMMLQAVAGATPGVEPVLPELVRIPVPVWLVTHREVRTSRRIRLVYDVLAEALAAPRDR